MERIKRRSLKEIFRESRNKNDVDQIERGHLIVSAINFDLEEQVRKLLAGAVEKFSQKLPELVSSTHIICDVTDKHPPIVCPQRGCHNLLRKYETRLLYAYDEDDFEYSIGEFDRSIANILLSTRKKATICYHDLPNYFGEQWLKDKFTEDLENPVLRLVKSSSSNNVLPFRRGGRVFEMEKYRKK